MKMLLKLMRKKATDSQLLTNQVSGINSRKAWLRNLYCQLPWVNPVTLFADDTENSFRCIKNFSSTLSKVYLRYPEVTEQFLASRTTGDLVCRRWGVETQLRRNGLPQYIPVECMEAINSMGKNAADMQMTLDLSNVGWNVRHVIIGSADSDMGPVLRCLEAKGIKVSVLAFGPMSRVAERKVSHFLPVQGLLEALQKKSDLGNKHAKLLPMTRNAMRQILKRELASKQNTLSFSHAGEVLRTRFSAYSYHWYGYGSCKALVLEVLKPEIKAGKVGLSACGHNIQVSNLSVSMPAKNDKEAWSRMQQRLIGIAECNSSRLSLAEAGVMLRHEFNVHECCWFGYAGCKELIQALLIGQVELSECGHYFYFCSTRAKKSEIKQLEEGNSVCPVSEPLEQEQEMSLDGKLSCGVLFKNVCNEKQVNA